MRVCARGCVCLRACVHAHECVVFCRRVTVCTHVCMRRSMRACVLFLTHSRGSAYDDIHVARSFTFSPPAPSPSYQLPHCPAISLSTLLSSSSLAIDPCPRTHSLLTIPASFLDFFMIPPRTSAVSLKLSFLILTHSTIGHVLLNPKLQ